MSTVSADVTARTAPKSATTSSPTTRRSPSGQPEARRDGRAAGAGGGAGATCRSGLYLHIPFCRKRCHFCYFRVYTDKNATEVQGYLDVARPRVGALQRAARDRRPAAELRLLRRRHAVVSSRRGSSRASSRGWTPSAPGASAEEITFECEPGTLTESKLAAIRSIGVTRLSLGVENFDDAILEANGRAHRSPEIGKAYAFARSLGFPQINIDLIAGMLGETDENWRTCVQKTIDDGARQRHHLPDGAAVQHDDQQEPADGRRADAVPTAASPTGPPSGAGWRRRSRRSKRAGYIDRVGVYGGEESVDEVHLSRSAVAGRRHGRPRRRLVRPRQRRAHAEPRHVRGVLREHRRGPHAAGARAASDATRSGSSASSCCS